ncbi:MAG TPA: aminopeptidase P family N-terminal domain-containing protein, partial [Dongiaceae bacterium]|nr:aminopeptidase P family N-terminal domain-containing protein [Dongiaceae bacterium]
MTAYHSSKVDRSGLRRYRLERIRQQLRRHDYGGALLFDPPNVRYATDLANMQVWALHNKCRYVYVPTEGPVILFDYGCAKHLSEGYELVAETRTAFPHTYFTNGGRHAEFISGFAAEIADLVRRHGGGNRRLAVDKLDPVATHALEREGVVIADGEALMEWARAIKNADEIR